MSQRVKNIKTAVPKRGVRRGENVLFIKNVFCYPNDMNDNALDREVLGASFEPYSMFVRLAERIQKLK